MLIPFLYSLRMHKIPVGTQEWLYLMEALSQDLADSSLTRFYHVARAILVKDEALYDAYDRAFVDCFKNLEASGDDFQIKDEIWNWLNKMIEEHDRPVMPDIPKLTLEELRKKFLERLKEQQEEHHGGNHWIGTGGTSPFGHGGSHPSGMRVGGPGGGRSAVKIAEERRFENYRHDRILDTRQMKVALKRLRRLDHEGQAEELQLDKSIDKTVRNAGEIELVFEPPKKNQTELLLLMDVGGSMDPYARMVESLFSAAHASSHFKAFHHYYFHNCIYSRLYTDMRQRASMPTEDIFHKFRKSFHVIFVGDACMGPYELFSSGGIIDYDDNDSSRGIDWMVRIKNHFAKSVWLNPEPQSTWDYHPTIQALKKIFPMQPLSVAGLTEAVNVLRKQ